MKPRAHAQTIRHAPREAHFPAIEKKYGEKMAYWLKLMEKLDGKKYQEQVAHLRENYGFSQAHANTVVMYARGSTSSKRFDTPAQYFKTITPQQAKTIKSMYKVIKANFPQLELVIAWNLPIFKFDKRYVFGAAAFKNHILIGFPDHQLLKTFAPRLKDFTVNKTTFAVPNDWEVDTKLIKAIVKAALRAK